MNAKVFLDTNVLLYTIDPEKKDKQKVAKNLVRDLWIKKNGCLSVQVLNEFYANATRKVSLKLDRELAWSIVDLYQEWKPVPLEMKTLQRAFSVQSRYQLSWWDSLIVSAAESAGCGKILSEDLSHGAKYFGIEVENPFFELGA